MKGVMAQQNNVLQDLHWGVGAFNHASSSLWAFLLAITAYLMPADSNKSVERMSQE